MGVSTNDEVNRCTPVFVPAQALGLPGVGPILPRVNKAVLASNGGSIVGIVLVWSSLGKFAENVGYFIYLM